MCHLGEKIDFIVPNEVANDIKNFVIEGGVLRKYTGLGGNVTIPDTVECIGENAFSECIGLASITIPEGVRIIEQRAFYDCQNIRSISLPKSIEKIGKEAFYGVGPVEEFNYSGTKTIISGSSMGYPILKGLVPQMDSMFMYLSDGMLKEVLECKLWG